MLDWLFLIFSSVRFLCCSFSLSIYILGTLSETRSRRKGRRRKTEEEERQGEESYRSQHRSELVDSWSKDRSIKRISSQLEDGIESTRSEIHLNSVCTISVVCNSAVNTSILLLLSLYYCCHYSSINHYAAALYRRNTLHLISCVIKYISRKKLTIERIISTTNINYFPLQICKCLLMCVSFHIYSVNTDISSTSPSKILAMFQDFSKHFALRSTSKLFIHV